jgi:DNA-binding MarR family transcriptional regulator
VAEDCRATSTQCHLLTELGRSGPLALSELGARVSLEKSWVSRAVEAMVTRGLVDKQPNPADARSWIVSLTPEGRRTVKALNQRLDQHAEGVLAHLSGPDRAAVQQALGLLLGALQAAGEGGP